MSFWRLALSPLRRPSAGSWLAVASSFVAALSLTGLAALYTGASTAPARALDAAGPNVSAVAPKAESAGRIHDDLAAAIESRNGRPALPLRFVSQDAASVHLRAPAGSASVVAQDLAARLPSWRIVPIERTTAAEERVVAVLAPLVFLLTAAVMVTCGLCLTASLVGLLEARRKELALQVALGATRSQLFRLLVGEVAAYATAGSLAGAAAGRFLAASLATRYFDAQATLPPVLAISIAGVLVLVVAGSLLVPYFRIPRLVPAAGLRGE